jgi:hypothetical protein
MIHGRIIADSISPQEIRLTTFQLRYPRFIHAELMTHRVFSRNARSSRAVPVKTLLSEDEFVPHFMKNQPGMQSFEEMDPVDRLAAEAVWDDMIAHTRAGVEKLHALGVHKQWANRPLEWFGFIDVLVSSTEWANWYALRNHEAAMPEIHELAAKMAEAHRDSVPKLLLPGEWHLPYINHEDRLHHDLPELRVISTARSARLSYKPFDGNGDFINEKARFERLVVSRPVHASPAEHQATPDERILSQSGMTDEWKQPELQGNFTGWVQFRKMLNHEAVMDGHHDRF